MSCLYCIHCDKHFQCPIDVYGKLAEAICLLKINKDTKITGVTTKDPRTHISI